MYGFLAAESGFEPEQSESESLVLPLHNSAICLFQTTIIWYHKFLCLSILFLKKYCIQNQQKRIKKIYIFYDINQNKNIEKIPEKWYNGKQYDKMQVIWILSRFAS